MGKVFESVALLLSCAGEFGVDVAEVTVGGAFLTVPVVGASQRTTIFDIEINQTLNQEVQARERSPVHLPVFCPERHIQERGWFCLYWSRGDKRRVTDLESARQWWVMLLRYLNRQLTASKLHRWFGPTRAHGNAADHQDEAERIAAEFGPTFLAALQDGVFRVRHRTAKGKQRIELLRGGTCVARVSGAAQGGIDLRTPCLCDNASGNAVAVGACGTHAVQLRQFILAINRWQQQDRKYVAMVLGQGARCCGTMLTCPLRD